MPDLDGDSAAPLSAVSPLKKAKLAQPMKQDHNLWRVKRSLDVPLGIKE